MASGPMEQFQIDRQVDLFEIAGQTVSWTNSAFWMVASVLAIIAFFVLTMRGKLIPGRMQSLGELSYEFIADMVRDTVGPEAMRFMPFVFALFFFILFANLIGMNPYAFTTTSHLAVTAAMAIFTILIVMVAGIWKNGFKWFKIFAPAGLPLPMYAIIIPIEIISFLSRPVTLAVRLFANMVAGHVMLKLFAIFAAYLIAKGGVTALGAILPIAGTIAIVALEFLVAALQAFVFAILTCVYLNDVYHVEH
ncbi:ATP synthase subunit a [Algimonas ampicilliniresistens]|uniref:ATP synthase subunit a n=1 Tax=Algimonas ampicilliniresistens TaxID=1298735 RepID=A0ABQ5V7S8_9PROT|nr:F0F1 ATP synthase subunit A [Algimonas ampicilliniresistens]GLQ23598.1 ATP synthase subunit a [Algimonas ampicilliniresistens]